MKYIKLFERIKDENDVNFIDPRDGSSSLIIAVIEHDLDKVKRLISEGANLNHQSNDNFDGLTALMWAINEYNEGNESYPGIPDVDKTLEILKEIAKQEQDLSLKNIYDETFWDLAGPKTREILLSVAKDRVELFLNMEKYNL